MHHARVLLKAATGFVVTAMMTAGCTFLVSFDDVARPDDGGGGGATGEASTPKDTGVDAFLDGGGGTDTGAPKPGEPDVCDTTAFPTNTIKGCEAFQDNGQICADVKGLSFAPSYDASADVVTCSKVGAAHASCIKHCHGPGKCAHNPTNVPDQCDRCDDKANGTYCGGEMAGWPSDTFNVLVTCANSRISTPTIACPTTCNTNGGVGKAACK